MHLWWAKSSSKVAKRKSNRKSIITSLHRTCIRPRSPQRCSDSSTKKKSQSREDSRSPSPSELVSHCQNCGKHPREGPLPLPHNRLPNNYSANPGESASKEPSRGKHSKNSPFWPLPDSEHVKVGAHAADCEEDLAAASSGDGLTDTDDPSESRIISPEVSLYEYGIKSSAVRTCGVKLRDQSSGNRTDSRKMLKSAKVLSNDQTGASSKQRLVSSCATPVQIPRGAAVLRVPEISVSSPCRSPLRVFSQDPLTNTSFRLGETSRQLLWPQSRCNPECSPLPSPRVSLCTSSRTQTGAVTRAGGPSTGSPAARSDDGKPQRHRLPLPPVRVSNSTPFSPSYAAGTSPGGRTNDPPSPALHWKKGRLIGRGAFGQVYLGFTSENGEMCAMKEVTLVSDDPKSKESAQQLGQEIALLSRLRHPNIVQYYGSETVDDKVYIYLEYVSGGSLYKILQEFGPLGEAAIRSYTQQILSGLAYLHAKNTLHRDIKGANILVDPNGRVKLADFGMAKHMTGPSCPLSFKGSPYWIAPEVLKNSGSCNLAVDIWSLGCTVLEMATTKPPWSQYEGVAALFKIGYSNELPAIPDHLSDEGKDFIRQCLQRNPHCRPTAAQLLEHPFIRSTALLERPILIAEPLDDVSAITNGVRSLGFGLSGTHVCLESSGAVNHPKSSFYGPGFSDAYLARNISCPVSPMGSSRSHSRPQQQMKARLYPSAMSSPRYRSDASTLIGGDGNGTLLSYNPEQTTNHFHENMGMILRNMVEWPPSQERKDQLYEANFIVADRVSQQLLRRPITPNQGTDLSLNSPRPSYNTRI